MVYRGPIEVDPDVVAAKATQRGREIRCVCSTSPFCRGPLTSDWLTCFSSCRACTPDPWQAPTRAPALAGGTD